MSSLCNETSNNLEELREADQHRVPSQRVQFVGERPERIYQTAFAFRRPLLRESRHHIAGRTGRRTHPGSITFLPGHRNEVKLV